jgi:hypothetical protein
MTTQGNFDEEEVSRRTYTAPYNSNHPVPTVQRYREHRDELQNQQKQEEETYNNREEGKLQHAVSSVRNIFVGQDNKHAPGDPYPAENRNDAAATQRQEQSSPVPPAAPAKDKHYVPHAPQIQQNSEYDAQEVGRHNEEQKDSKDSRKNGGGGRSATEINAGITDPRQKRKNMKHMKRDDGGREVTDPVTHLPVVIYDSTDKRLEKAPENETPSDSMPRSATGLSGDQKSKSQIDLETRQIHDEHAGMQKVFPPPNFDDAQAELKRTYQFALTVALASIVTFATLVLVLWQLLTLTSRDTVTSGSSVRLFVPIFITVILSAVFGFSIIWGVRGWLGKKVEEIWQDEIWDAARDQETEEIESRSLPESTQWLNSLLASVWPLINPDLFISLSDTLEDVMQASLPKMVRMVSVNDLGQGSESFRVLGVKWLPAGAASQSVDDDGNLKSRKSKEKSDRAAPGDGEVEDDDKSDEVEKDSSGDKEDTKEQQGKKQKQQEQEAMAEGLEAEQGKRFNLFIHPHSCT